MDLTKKVIGELIINFTNYSDVFVIFATAVAKNIKNCFEFRNKFKVIFFGNFLSTLKDISYTKNNFKRLKIENEANKRKKARKFLQAKK